MLILSIKGGGGSTRSSRYGMMSMHDNYKVIWNTKISSL